MPPGPLQVGKPLPAPPLLSARCTMSLPDPKKPRAWGSLTRQANRQYNQATLSCGINAWQSIWLSNGVGKHGRKAWKKSSQGKQTVELVVKVSEKLRKIVGNVTLPKHVTCVTWRGQSVFISSLPCTVPHAVLIAVSRSGPLHLPASSCWCLSPLTASCCHVPAAGQAAPLLALHSPQFTLLCISAFCLTSSLDVLTLQNSYPSPSISPCTH